MKSRSTFFITATLLFGVIFYAKINDTTATTLLHRNAEELTRLADRIFMGTCTSAKEKTINISGESQMICTEYTFNILTGIKGVDGNTVKLRQLGKANGVGSIIGMPNYEKGHKYIIFLRNESRYGLASPIGLGQGTFQVINTDAVNNFGNKGLFQRMDLKSQRYKVLDENEKILITTKKGKVNVDSFVSIIQKLLRLRSGK